MTQENKIKIEGKLNYQRIMVNETKVNKMKQTNNICFA
jgi:hypothetical protein